MFLHEKLRPWRSLKTCEKLIAAQNKMIELKNQIAELERQAHARDLKAAQDDFAAKLAAIDQRFLEGLGVSI